MRKAITLRGALFIGYIGVSLLTAGWNKHGQDGGSHLGLFIGGAVIVLAALAQATGMISASRGKCRGVKSGEGTERARGYYI